MSAPLVTIGIPTYNRPELLPRALRCVAAQDYANIELIVADNCTPGERVREVVERFGRGFSQLRFIRHATNIGSVRNFLSVLDTARGKYFMWLADDDEISPNYVSALVALLEANPQAASAAGHWISIDESMRRTWRATSSFPERCALRRALRFIWRTDDAFFYALHRTSCIRRASFPGYWWPNRDIVVNWGYVFLLDLVLSGPILLASDASVQFVNYCDTPKFYATGSGGLTAISRFVARRLNVHCLYLAKTGRALGMWAAAAAAPVSAAALLRELGSFAAELVALLPKRFATREQQP